MCGEPVSKGSHPESRWDAPNDAGGPRGSARAWPFQLWGPTHSSLGSGSLKSGTCTCNWKSPDKSCQISVSRVGISSKWGFILLLERWQRNSDFSVCAAGRSSSWWFVQKLGEPAQYLGSWYCFCRRLNLSPKVKWELTEKYIFKFLLLMNIWINYSFDQLLDGILWENWMHNRGLAFMKADCSLNRLGLLSVIFITLE